MAQKQKGAFCVLIAALLFSTGGVLVKLIPWSPYSINGMRNVFAVAVTFIYLKSIKHKIVFNKSVLIGALALSLTNLLYVCGTKFTTAANAIVLQYTSPVFIIIFMWIFFKQKPHRLDIGACLLIFSGIVCFFVESIQGGGMLGNLLSLTAGVTFAGVFMINMLPGADSLSAFFYGQLISAVTGLPFVFFESEQTLMPWLAVAFLGIFQIGIAYIFMSKGLATTPPVTASLISALEPILNPIWVAIFYGEVIGPISLIGALIVTATIIIYNVAAQKRAGR